MKAEESIFTHAELSEYSFQQRLLIRLADLAFYWLISFIGKTLNFETEGENHLKEIKQKGKLPIYAFWHNRIFASTYFFRNQKIVVMTSQSFDGEYIARFIQRFGYGAVRGSSTRGGITALAKMIKLMKQGFPMAFTVDGPKGPKYVAKMGACLLAKKTQNPILPFLIECENFWQIRSTWDELQIPKPFSRAKVFFAKPIEVEADAEDEKLEEKRLELQGSLDELVKLGQKWRNKEVN
ncbi:MAG: lysophospholipid acyltransferase family protein [Pyrinomonadaceae bacterium]|nr:lysophospholipid acyltransferase family protein [Pyrinomonadaceae bacterium]MCX7639889.1 lysophospholipid acyltransferase family protein [Pyrinomonadaceae bacterium]MDW8304061.1 lysophospholipid acyltransferase family protein [Acidobacteriota bacterium]